MTKLIDKNKNGNGKGFDHQYEAKTINGDKVVIDSASGLMWQQSGSDNPMKYEAAKKWIDKLNQKGYAGFNDWRLPTIEETMSLMEPESMELYINPIFDKEQSWIWTADQVKGESRAAWVVDFEEADGSWRNVNHDSYVRAVRSGQSSYGG